MRTAAPDRRRTESRDRHTLAGGDLGQCLVAGRQGGIDDLRVCHRAAVWEAAGYGLAMCSAKHELRSSLPSLQLKGFPTAHSVCVPTILHLIH